MSNGEEEPTLSPYALKGPYISTLSPADEQTFQQWVKQNNIPFDPSKTADYDMRGFWSALVSKDPRAVTAISPYDNQIHFPDVWKTPYHRTFSNESIYASKDAPHWEGYKLIDKNGNVVADETPKETKK